MILWPLEQEYYRKQLFNAAVEAVNELKPGQRGILRSLYLHDFQLWEVVDATGKNYETVKHQRYRALKTVRKKVKRLL